MTQHPTSMRVGTNETWQDEAWAFYDNVGELRFAVNWLANGMSRVNLIAARQPTNLGDEPTPLVPTQPGEEEEEIPLTGAEALAVELVQGIAGGVGNQGQLLSDVARHLSVPGVGWILLRAAEPPGPGETVLDTVPVLTPSEREELPPTPDETWTWTVLAYDSVRAQGEHYEVQYSTTGWVPLTGDFVLVKVWRPHPRRIWEADSPVRAVRTVLQRIQLLDEHVTATAQSRLAGAGLLIMPNEAEFSPVPGMPGEAAEPLVDPLEEDDFVEVLVETMTLPIKDRGSAAAVVPLVARMPGDLCDKPRHLTFWTEFSESVQELQEAAVRRLALGLDIPPEVLEGKGGMNHWGAWQVAEEAVTLHIEPMSETTVQALTIGYLRPHLQAAGYEAEADDLLVWYDATDLTTRPDRSDDAIAAYDRLELSGEALRRESGLSESDAPDPEERHRRALAILASTDPIIATEYLDTLEAGMPAGAPAPPADGEATGPPSGPPSPEEAPAAAVMEACDGLVFRALERAGQRLKGAAGRKHNGGAAAITCPDPTRLHVELHGATQYEDLDRLMDGAWVRVPPVAQRLGLDPEMLTSALDSYVRALLATGHEHDQHRLASVLGLPAPA